MKYAVCWLLSRDYDSSLSPASLKQTAEITRIKEHVSRMALMNNNVAITVLNSGEFGLLQEGSFCAH